ncbi:hypothetical protein N7494_001672 [Penicillium frequentans]|uniref:Uncharacterized protein n=1 Tax=Penicillium frequentans TaxID=3151616 RepID=A0AAD6GI25_9EURO|nr:hypothetical protein N7494_001672 [Penicillium glabrum]
MYGEVEFYFECAQTEVESESIVTPGPNVKIKGVYMGYGSGNLIYTYRDWIVSYYAWPKAITWFGLTQCYDFGSFTRYLASYAMVASSFSKLTSTPLVRAQAIITLAGTANTALEQAVSTQAVFTETLAASRMIGPGCGGD